MFEVVLERQKGQLGEPDDRARLEVDARQGDDLVHQLYGTITVRLHDRPGNRSHFSISFNTTVSLSLVPSFLGWLPFVYLTWLLLFTADADD